MSTKSRANRTAANKRAAEKVAAVVKTTKAKAQPNPCGCLSHIAYRVTAADIPEADPDGFVEYDVYENCGGETLREFLPGHDAKLKSRLIERHLDGGEIAYLAFGGTTLMHTSAMDLAEARGWGKFLTAAQAKQERKAAARTARAVASAAAKLTKDNERAAAKAAKAASKPATTTTKAATKTEQKAADTKAKAESQKPVKGVHPVRVKIGRMVHDANVIAEGVNEVTVQYKRRQAGALIDTTTVVKRAQIVND